MRRLASVRRAVRAATPALALGTAALTAALAACSDGPTSPTGSSAAQAAVAAGPAHSTSVYTGYTGYSGTTTSGSTLVTATALMRTTPITVPIMRSVTLHATGGTLQIPEAGLMVTIPRGAVGDSTATITATALPGSAVAYDFQPHGAKFLTQLKINQSLAATTWAGNTGMMNIGAGYFASNSQVNTYTGAAQLNEVITGTVAGGTYQFYVGHFSGYLVSWGRY